MKLSTAPQLQSIALESTFLRLVDLSQLKLVSGGQTGADRAALDWAMARKIPHGGWCPRGRLAEDGEIAPQYPLNETPAAEYAQRTEWNVRDSDGTVIFTISATLVGGSRKTAMFAQQHHKPCLHLAADTVGADAAMLLRGFILRRCIRVLNVAGSRASEEPGIGNFVRATLEKAFPSEDRSAA